MRNLDIGSDEIRKYFALKSESLSNWGLLAFVGEESS